MWQYYAHCYIRTPYKCVNFNLIGDVMINNLDFISLLLIYIGTYLPTTKYIGHDVWSNNITTPYLLLLKFQYLPTYILCHTFCWIEIKVFDHAKVP